MDGGLRGPWSRRFQVLVSLERRIQVGLENVVKVIIKFIEGEGKAPQKKEQLAPAGWDRSSNLYFKRPL
jgi:hypothetical protein